MNRQKGIIYQILKLSQLYNVWNLNEKEVQNKIRNRKTMYDLKNLIKVVF